jgi:glutathione S-transferase
LYSLLARLILHYAKQPFDDVRITHADWPKLKPSTPFGQVPVLEVDGKPLAQSFAIYRYLARQFGLAGKDDFEAAKIDAVADFLKDIGNEMRTWFMVAMGRTEGDKAQLEKDVLNPAAEKMFKVLEKALDESGSGFAAASGVTWLDFLISERLYTLEQLKPEFLNGHEKLAEYVKRVQNLPEIKSYMESRPKSQV